MGKAARHKENLVRTAMRLFRRQGYASTGLQQILAESGAPRGSLYHYFPSGKESLGEAAVGLAGGMIRDVLSDLAARHREPKAFLRAYCRVMAGWMEESGFHSGCPVATTLLETAPQSPAITAAGRQAIDGWIEVIAGVLARGGVDRREARSRAQLVVAAMEGALILSRVRRSARPILDVATLV
ncbi:MAG TPA: TetR/AcrR family transcriptional regulator [Solirubrobacterales bacterium]|nr:TetR/AcrR family transcriptional regulator [Solirubrobacterales bacterium]